EAQPFSALTIQNMSAFSFARHKAGHWLRLSSTIHWRSTMRAVFVAAAAASLIIANAWAQAPQAPATKQIPPAASEPGNPAVKGTEKNTATAPVAGANSFIEGEAKSRIEARGVGNGTQLRKEGQGIWRGKAQRNGTMVDVALDFQGNVFPAQP